MFSIIRRRWFALHAKENRSSFTRGGRYRPRVESLEDRSLPSLVTVTSASDDPNDTHSLRYAINHATPGETIDVAAKVRTIDLSSTLTIGVSLTIINDQGVGPVTIDGGGRVTVLEIPDSSATVWLSGLTIADGNATSGNGGGIYNNGSLGVSHCIVSGNSVENSGYGGGIFNNGVVAVYDSAFSNNSAPSSGGGIFNNTGTKAVVRNCTFSDNSAAIGAGGGGGGGIYGVSCNMMVYNSTFSDNAAANGGGIDNEGGGTLSVTNSTFANNSAAGGGGIANFESGTLIVTNSTFSANTAGTFNGNGIVAVGGGMYVGQNRSLVTLNGDIVTGNVNAASGASPDDISGSVGLSSADNLIGIGGSGGLVDGHNGNQVGVGVADVGLGLLASDGGPTQTFAIGPGSLALGRGVTETITTTDQRGVPRPVNQPSDAGAYQYSEDPASVTVASGSPQNTIIGTPFGTALQALVVDASGDPLANIPVTFAVPASGPTGTLGALATVLTNALGIATAPTLMANHVEGLFTATATVGGVASPADFTLTNTAVPAAIRVVAGAGQRATIGTAYARELEVKVTNASGPVAGISVVFELPTGASGVFAGSAVVVTNASGIATSPMLTANTQAGRFTVNAWVAGVSSPASFGLTNLPLAPNAVNSVGGTPQSAATGQRYTTRLQAQVVDQYGNPLRGVTVKFTAPTNGASGSFGGSKTVNAVTDADGNAAVTITANNTAGGFQVTASVANLSHMATFELTNVVTPAVKAVAKRTRSFEVPLTASRPATGLVPFGDLDNLDGPKLPLQ
jgi:hypothetical protein